MEPAPSGMSLVWHVQDLTSTELSASVARGLRPGLGVELFGFLRHVTGRIRFEDALRQPLDLSSGSIHHRNETLIAPGDPWLLLHGSRGLGTWTLAARAGVSLPLGRTGEDPFELGRRGLPHQHIQFGTGTVDPILGLAASTRVGATIFSLNTLGRIVVAENGKGYQAGNRWLAAASADGRIRGAWRWSTGLDLAREDAETWDGRVEEEGNLGRTDVLLSIGLGHALRGAGGLSLTAKVPLVTRATGAQLDYPVLLVLGWSR
jgi:hypothetical protein